MKLGKYRELRQHELMEILSDLQISRHAKERMKERGATLEQLENPVVAYQGIDYSYNVAIDDYRYFVIERNINYHNPKFYNQKKYILVTFNEKSNNGISIWDRIKMEKQGKRGKHRPKYMR